MYVQVHRRPRLQVAELEQACRHVRVGVEESEEGVLELGEFGLVGQFLVPVELVVQQVDAFGLEEGSQLGVVVNEIAQVHFVDFGVDAAVADAGPEEEPGHDSEGLEAGSEVPELVEEKGEGGEDVDLEWVLEAPALVEVVLEGGEGAIEEVLVVGVEGGADSRSVFGFGHIFGFESVAEVSIVGGSPLVLPTDVVGVTAGVAEVGLGAFEQPACHATS